MRVGLFCSSSNRGGVQTYTLQLSSALRSRGHEVVVITPWAETAESARLRDELRAVADELVVSTQHTRPIELIRWLTAAIRASCLDVFIPNFRTTSYAACASLGPTDRPAIVGVCHDNSQAYYRLLYQYRDVIDGFVCPSRKTYEVLRRVMADREAEIVHIPYCLRWPCAPAPSPPTEKIGLLYHGRLSNSQKNVSLIIRLGAELLRRALPFEITIVGDGEAEVDCRNLAGRLGLDRHVTFYPACQPSELLDFFTSHHLAVLTSSHEGFCISLAEAMSVGLPGIAFSCGGVIEEYLQNGVNGYIVPFGDLEGMADRVEYLYRWPDRWSALSLQARGQLHAKYDPVRILDQYDFFLSSLDQGERRSRWPRFRPVYSSDESPRWHRFVEKVGAAIGAWDSSRSIIGRLVELDIHR